MGLGFNLKLTYQIAGLDDTVSMLLQKVQMLLLVIIPKTIPDNKGSTIYLLMIKIRM